MQMTSLNSSESPPIILIPTDHAAAINSGPGVTVKTITQSNQSVSWKEMINSNVKALKDEVKTLFTFHPKEWISAFRPNHKFPLFVLGDIDGFVALFMNNLATLLAVILGLKLVFENDIIYGKIVPG
jgi:hypothetical protein